MTRKYFLRYWSPLRALIGAGGMLLLICQSWLTCAQAPRRSFLRRTKATAPPESADVEPTESSLSTTSRLTTRRGISKFKLRKELEKEVKNTKNVTENDAENSEDRNRRPAPIGGPRRTERPTATRNFARRKPGGANGTTTLTPSSVSTAGTTRRPFRIAARRRPSSTTSTTTTTTTTTTQPTTVADDPAEIEESLQAIGDTDAIEDPSLDPREPKISNKIQRRPLVTLKDETKDQNPSATNEEESKRQSKKYSSSFKQNQLEDLLKSKTRLETTTEFKTTLEDISAETALAIATHQLMTAPVPITQNFDDIDPSKTKTTQSYKYTSPQLNEFTDNKTPAYEKYPSTPTYRNTATNGYAQTTSGEFSTQFDTPKLSTTLEVTNPTTTLSYRTIDSIQRGYSTLSTIPDSAEITSTFDVPKTTTVSQSTRYSQPAGFSTLTTDYDSSRISTFFDTASPTATNTFSTNPRPYFSTLTTEYETPTFTSTYDVPRSTNTFSTKDSRELTYSTGTTDFNTRESSTDFETPRTIPSRRRQTTSATNPTEFNSGELTTSSINTPRSPRTRYTSTPSNTITEEYFETTRGTFADTPTDYRSRIPSTFTSPDPTTTVVNKRSRQRLSSPNIVSTGYTGVSERVRSSTLRYVASTERFLTGPVEDTSFSTAGYSVSSQEPSYFTREYLLESPVTKTYDDEYQYLSSPKTTPQPRQRKIFRKKVQRRISTTLRPTTTSTTTETPKTTKPFVKITRAPVKTYKPIVNYDYYDDSEEKLVEKYEAGTKVVLHDEGTIECRDVGNFPHPTSCKKFISCARMEGESLIGWEYICPKGLSFDPVGGICNWSAGLGCDEKDV